MKQQLKWNEMSKKQKAWFIIKSCLSLIMVIGILIFMVETVMYSCGYAKGAQKETASAATTGDQLYQAYVNITEKPKTVTIENPNQDETLIEKFTDYALAKYGTEEKITVTIEPSTTITIEYTVDSETPNSTNPILYYTSETLFIYFFNQYDELSPQENNLIEEITITTTIDQKSIIIIDTEEVVNAYAALFDYWTGTIPIVEPYFNNTTAQSAYQQGYDAGLIAGQTATGNEGWILPAGGISFNGSLTGNTGDVYITRTQLGTLNKIFGSEYVISNTTFKIIGAEQGSEGINTPYWVSEKWNSQGQGASSVNSANIYIGQSSSDTKGVALTLVQRQIDSPPITISLKSFGNATALISDVPINFTQWKVNGAYLTKAEAQDMVQFFRDLGWTQLNLDFGTGYEQGYADGNAYGSATGYQNGYDAGYAAGEAAGEQAAGNFNFSWLINFASGLFGINVFGGFTLGDLVYTMLAIAIFGGILKLFFGG